jgi:hypothetical protein
LLIEIESGKRSDRPRLAEALKACRLQGAKLIIAKLDRLARNVAFISNLMESKVEFEAVDFPQANLLTIHIMAAIAEHEAKMISDRTRAALAAAKARGKRLHNPLGKSQSIHENETANERLRTDLTAHSSHVLEGAGIDPSGDWPEEKSFYALGIDLQTGRNLGQKYQQDATPGIVAKAR